jgi:hypothetical protein
MTAQAAPLMGLSNTFKSISGNSEKMLNALREGSSGMIRDAELMKKYNMAAQLVNRTFAEQLPEAMQYLSRVSASTGQSMDYMLDSLVRGVGRLSPMILDNLAIQVNLTQANEAYAQQMGVSADSLSKAEQQTAMMNLVMQKLRQNMGGVAPVTGSATQAIASFDTTMANLKDQVGAAFVPVLQAAMGEMGKLASAVGPKLVEWAQIAAEALIGRVVPAIESIGSTLVRLIGFADKVVDVVSSLVVPAIAGLGAVAAMVAGTSLVHLVASLMSTATAFGILGGASASSAMLVAQSGATSGFGGMASMLTGKLIPALVGTHAATIAAVAPFALLAAAVAGVVYVVQQAAAAQKEDEQAARNLAQIVLEDSRTFEDYSARMDAMGKSHENFATKTAGYLPVNAQFTGALKMTEEEFTKYKAQMDALSMEGVNTELGALTAQAERIGKEFPDAATKAKNAIEEMNQAIISEEAAKKLEEMWTDVSKSLGDISGVMGKHYQSMAKAASDSQLEMMKSDATYNAQRGVLVKAGKTKEVQQLDTAHKQERVQRELQNKITTVQTQHQYNLELAMAKQAFYNKLALWIQEGMMKGTIQEQTGTAMLAGLNGVVSGEIAAQNKAMTAVLALSKQKSSGYLNDSLLIAGAAQAIGGAFEAEADAAAKAAAEGTAVDWSAMQAEIQTAMNQLAELGADVGDATTGAQATAESATATMDSVMGDIASALDNAISAFEKAAGVRAPAGWERSLREVAGAIEVGVKVLYESFNRLGKEQVTQAGEFADNASKVTNLVKDAVDAFDRMSTYKRPADLVARIKTLASDVQQVVTEFMHVGWSFGTAENWRDIPKAAGEFADMVAKVVSGLNTALDFLIRLGEPIPAAQTSVEHVMSRLQGLIASVDVQIERLTAQGIPFPQLTDAAVQWLTDAKLSAAAMYAFLDEAGKAFAALGSAIPIQAVTFREFYERYRALVIQVNEYLDPENSGLLEEVGGFLGEGTVAWLAQVKAQAAAISDALGGMASVMDALSSDLPTEHTSIEKFFIRYREIVDELNAFLDPEKAGLVEEIGGHLGEGTVLWLRQVAAEVVEIAEPLGAIASVVGMLSARMPRQRTAIADFFTRYRGMVDDLNAYLEPFTKGGEVSTGASLSEGVVLWLEKTAEDAKAIGEPLKAVADIFASLSASIPRQRTSVSAFFDAYIRIVGQVNEYASELSEQKLPLPKLGDDAADWLADASAAGKAIGDFLKGMNEIFTELGKEVPTAETSFSDLMGKMLVLMAEVERDIAAAKGWGATAKLSDDAADWLADMTASVKAISDAVKGAVELTKALGEDIGTVDTTRIGDAFTQAGLVIAYVNTLVRNQLDRKAFGESVIMNELSADAQDWLEALSKALEPLSKVISAVQSMVKTLGEEWPKPTVSASTVFQHALVFLQNWMALSDLPYWKTMLDKVNEDFADQLDLVAKSITSLSSIISGTVKAVSDLRFYQGGTLTPQSLAAFEEDLRMLLLKMDDIQTWFIEQGLKVEEKFTTGVEKIVGAAGTALSFFRDLGGGPLEVSHARIHNFGVRLRQLLDEMVTQIGSMKPEDLANLKTVGDQIGPMLLSAGSAWTVLAGLSGTTQVPTSERITSFVTGVTTLINGLGGITISDTVQANFKALAPLMNDMAALANSFADAFKKMEDAPGNVTTLADKLKQSIVNLFTGSNGLWFVYDAHKGDWTLAADWAADLALDMADLADAFMTIGTRMTSHEFAGDIDYGPIVDMMTAIVGGVAGLVIPADWETRVTVMAAIADAALALAELSKYTMPAFNVDAFKAFEDFNGALHSQIEELEAYTLELIAAIEALNNAIASMPQLTVMPSSPSAPGIGSQGSYQSGGWIPNTGSYTLHQGEYVMSAADAGDGGGAPTPWLHIPTGPGGIATKWSTQQQNITVAPEISIIVQGAGDLDTRKKRTELKQAIRDGIKEAMPTVVSETSKAITNAAKLRRRYGSV